MQIVRRYIIRGVCRHARVANYAPELRNALTRQFVVFTYSLIRTLWTHHPYIACGLGVARYNNIAVTKNEMKTMNNRNAPAANFTDLYSSRYYRLTKRMLGILGQWPYQSVLESKIRVCVPLFISITVLIPQIRSMVFTCHGLDRFLECFSPLATNIGCNLKLINFMLKKPWIKKLLDVTLEEWKEVQHLSEVNILRKCAEKGRVYTVLWASGLYFSVAVWVSLMIVPKILDVINRLNHTRKVFEVIPVDFGVDPEKYYYPIQIYCWSGTVLVLLIIPAIDTLYMCLAQHVCAMFDLLRWNLENIIREDETVSVMLEPNLNVDEYYHKVVACIKKHKRLVEYINIMASTNESCLFFMVGLNMVGLTITAYQAVGKDTEPEDAIRYTVYSISVLVHLFVITLPGHWIMSSSSALQNHAYGTRWYMMSLRTRKLILLIIRSSIEPRTITAGKIYVMSLENFSCVLRTSLSYLTVLISMQ